MDDIQNLFKDTIAEFMKNGLDAELGYSKYDCKNKNATNSSDGHSPKTLRTRFGNMDIAIPRDLNGDFDSVILKKIKSVSAMT